jgi:hypothetical protein
MFFILLFWMSSVFAEEHCNVAESIGLKVQDQDGVASCYGNSISLLAQAADERKRPMSFFASALLARSESNSDITLGVGTNGCNGYTHIKNNGGICLAEHFPLENSSINPEVSLRLLSSLAMYFKGTAAHHASPVPPQVSRSSCRFTLLKRMSNAGPPVATATSI